MCQQVHKIKGKDTGISWQINASLKNVSGSYGEAVIRWKQQQQQQQIHRTEGKGKGKGPKAKHLGRVELHEQRKVRVPSAKIALLLSKAFQEPSHHI